MKLSKSFKYSLLSFMALASLGVTLNSSTTTAHAVQYQAAGDTTWSPHWSDGVKSSYSVTGAGSYLGVGAASWGADGMHSWVPKSGMTIKYHKLGKDPNNGKQIDMWVKLTNFKGVHGVGYKSKHGVSLNMYSGGSESMKATISFHYNKGGEVKWDNDVIGLAYTDLEPDKLGIIGNNPKYATSFNQSIKSNSRPSSWHPWTNSLPRYSWLDLGKAEADTFQVKNKLDLPPKLYGSTKTIDGKGWDPFKKSGSGYGAIVTEKKGKSYPDNLHNIWNDYGSRDLNPNIHYSGAIVEYKADGARTISLTIKGHGSGNNEYVFTGAKSYKKEAKSSISKSITYNGKTTKANTLKDKDDPMVYNINATVSAKKGAYITDALPKRFTVTKISSVTNFSHNSVADVNATHQFKATLKNDKLDGKNKKVTFHITGNMGDYMTKHPNVALKWPVANTAYWYQKQAASFC